MNHSIFNMNKKIFYKKSIILIVLLSGAIKLSAQVGNEEVKVVAPYEPTISDAYKINETPQILIQPEIEAPKVTYEIYPEKISTTFALEPIKPAQMIGEPLSKLYRFYTKAGLGNYQTPLFEAYFHNLRSKRYSYGIDLKHISSHGEIKDKANKRDFIGNYSNNEINMFGKRFLENGTLGVNVGYQRKVNYFYGYNPELVNDDLEKHDSLKQHFNKIEAKMNVFSTYKSKEKLHHAASISYKHFSDNYKASEGKFAINAHIAKDIGIIQYDLEQLRLDVNIDIYNNNNLLYEHNNALIKLNPRYTAIFKNFKFNLGTNIYTTADSVSDMYFYPDLKLDITLVEHVLVLYGTYEGHAIRNNFADMAEQNPFIISEIPISYSLEENKMGGGMKGSISSFFSYNLGFNSSEMQNMPLYVRDTDSNRFKEQFTVIFDDVETFNFYSEFASQIKERVKMLCSIDVYKFTLENEAEAWHKPKVEVNFGLQYNMRDKFLINFDILAYGESYAKTFNAQNEIVKEKVLGAVDMNLGIDYRYSKVLSFFTKLNNIEGVSHYRYYNYPTQKFNFMLGASYAF